MRYKFTFSILVVSALCCGCMRDNVDQNVKESEQSEARVSSLPMTRAGENNEIDTLAVISLIQSDHDNFMMGRVIFKTDRYELCIKRADAKFFGVTDELYDEYVSYVERLNAGLTQ